MTSRFLTLSFSLLGPLMLADATSASPAQAALAPGATDPPRSVVNSDSTLVWSPARRLTWADFKGAAGPAEKLHALTSADLSVEVKCADDLLDVQVQAVFRPLESWTRSNESAPLLRHEQLHFDLTEVHARLLRLSLQKLKMTCQQAQTQLKPLIDAAFLNWQNAQDRYDEEARHGLDPAGQARWEKQVAAQLKALR